MEDNRLSYLEEFNKGVENIIDFAEHDLNILKHEGDDLLEDIDGIIKEKPKELVHDFFGYRDIRATSLKEEDFFNRAVGFAIGKPVEIVEDTTLAVYNEIESTSAGRKAIEFVEETTKETAKAGAAVAVYTASNSTSTARQALDTVTTTAAGALEMVKNIPSKISEFASSAYNIIPSNPTTPYKEKFWSFIDSMSDFFYITCALVILGRFDFLLKNTYAVIVIGVLIVYTINTR